jgi:hypothetical protein
MFAEPYQTWKPVSDLCPAYEPCIEAAADEFTGIADTARLHAEAVLLAQHSDLSAVAADPVALVAKIDLIYKECYAHSHREFEHKALFKLSQNPPARATVPGPSRSRSRKSNQHGTQSDHGPGRHGPSTGTSCQQGEQQVPHRRLAPLAPSPVRDDTLAPLPSSQYAPHDMPHQQQGHILNTFRPVRDSGYREWPAQTTPGTTAFVEPTSNQYGFQPAHMPPPQSGWMGDSSAAHQFQVNMQHNQSPAAGSYPVPHARSIATHATHQRPLASDFPGTPETRQQAPSAYGVHASRHSHHSGLAGWPGNHTTNGNDGNQDAN